MIHENICKKCNKIFFTIKKSRKFCSEDCYHNSKKIELKEHILICNKCEKEYVLYLSESNFIKGNYKKNCSIECSNSRIMTDKIKNKISKSNTGKIYLSRRKEKVIKEKVIKEKVIKEILNRICINCGKEFKSKRKKLCCSLDCVNNRMKIGGSQGGKNSKQSKRSKNEIYFGELCKLTFDNVKFNENIFNGWDADIILLDYKLAIMWNGNWHYKKITKSHSLIQVQNRDNIKINEIIKYGFIPYIVKDEGRFNKKFVELKFEELKNYINKGV